ncbi:hypothetical protein M434DRAFT_38821 [Hypoxylon sp. CO27-5]|nr:hypothetical protein M434DRAFT_38821 [Hypoxylon sp. CO27-5]
MSEKRESRAGEGGGLKNVAATVTATPAVTGVDFLNAKHVTIDDFTNDHATVPATTTDIAMPTCIRTPVPTVIFGLLTLARLYQEIAYRKRFCYVNAFGYVALVQIIYPVAPSHKVFSIPAPGLAVRIIFRLIEFSLGLTGVSNLSLTNGTYFYVLEAMPMLPTTRGSDRT